ncbi:MAG: DUF3307 domain-containing protein [Elusimicrobiota bacterium]
MLIFWRLLFGHLLADFTFQTNFINQWKRSSFWGMMAHCATHPLFYVLLTYPYLKEFWINTPVVKLTGWACVLIVFVVHFIEDEWRVFTIFKYNTPDNTLYFLWDQVIHYAVIFAVIPVAFQNPSVSLLPEKWPVLGCLFVAVTHACTVLVYFIEKDLYDVSFPGFEEKYLAMVERLVLAMLFLVPNGGWLILVPAWLVLMYVLRDRRLLDLSWFNYYLGGAVAVGGGLCARFVYYL